MPSRERQPIAVERRPGPPFATILQVADWQQVRTRVLISPMHTLLATIWEIVAGRSRGVPDQWTQTVLHRAKDVDLAPFAFYAVEGIRLPDFFHDLLPGAAPSFDDQLERLAATPDDVILADLHYEYGSDVPDVLRPWATDPAAALERYVAAVDTFWRAVLAGAWPAIAAALHGEARRITGLLDALPTSEALRQIHPRLLVGAHMLWVDGGPIFETHVLSDRTLVLLPFAAGRDALMTAYDHPQGALVAYTAHGTLTILAGDRSPAVRDLVTLLGEARGRILLALSTGASTSQLASSLGYALSTTSEHLQTLVLMGLVDSTRHGKYVFHSRTDRGEGLIALYAS